MRYVLIFNNILEKNQLILQYTVKKRVMGVYKIWTFESHNCKYAVSILYSINGSMMKWRIEDGQNTVWHYLMYRTYCLIVSELPLDFALGFVWHGQSSDTSMCIKRPNKPCILCSLSSVLQEDLAYIRVHEEGGFQFWRRLLTVLLQVPGGYLPSYQGRGGSPPTATSPRHATPCPTIALSPTEMRTQNSPP